MELDREKWLRVVDYPLVSGIVSVGEENRPIRWQRGDIDGKTVVLGGYETTTTVAMETRLIVAAITVPAWEVRE